MGNIFICPIQISWNR